MLTLADPALISIAINTFYKLKARNYTDQIRPVNFFFFAPLPHHNLTHIPVV
jgi:hypothetical protein